MTLFQASPDSDRFVREIPFGDEQFMYNFSISFEPLLAYGESNRLTIPQVVGIYGLARSGVHYAFVPESMGFYHAKERGVRHPEYEDKIFIWHAPRNEFLFPDPITHAGVESLEKLVVPHFEEFVQDLVDGSLSTMDGFRKYEGTKRLFYLRFDMDGVRSRWENDRLEIYKSH